MLHHHTILRRRTRYSDSPPERAPLIGIPTPTDFIRARGSSNRSADAAYMAATDPMPQTKQ